MKGTRWTLCLMTVFSLLFCFSLGVSAKEVYQYHKVVCGESVWKIAKNYQVNTDIIVTANGLKNGGAYIEAGQTLLIDSNAKSNGAGNYVVKAKDTLYLIAKANGTSVKALMKDNGLTAARIYPGQKLSVSGQKKTESQPAVKSEGTKSAASSGATGNAAAASASAFTAEEVHMVAKMIYGEARGESYQGQVAVGAVIVNRVKSNLFPNTVAGVLFQKSQFTAYTDGQYFLTPDETAIQAAKEACAGVDPTSGCLFYWNPVKAPNNAFLNAKPIIVTIGQHVFAR